MIDGFVNQYLEPIVPVTILDINQYRWRQEVVVDTGFDGDLTFPSEFIQQLGFTSAGETDMTLADAQTVKCNFYQVTAIWDGDYRTVYLMESATQSLLGTNLMQGSMLTVQMWVGGDVAINYATPPSHPPP